MSKMRLKNLSGLQQCSAIGLFAFTILMIMIVNFQVDAASIQQSASRAIKGKVVDENGIAIPGVSVFVKGTSSGTVTDAEGLYSVVVSDTSRILVFTAIGIKTRAEEIAGRLTIDVAMEPDIATLGQVDIVGIGYGTANKRDLAGSIVTVSGKEVANVPNFNPMASLQGKVTGLSVVNTGVLGQAPDVRIRGTVSLSKTSPLYVVDGIFSDDISLVNPADIESMEVLKDPSSLAVFGVRGANGVVLITTKRAQQGKTSVSANFTYGVKNIVSAPEMTNRAGFIELYDEQRANLNIPAYSKYDTYTANTNWVDEIKQKNAAVSMNNISISSGTDKNKMYVGIGYQVEEGLIKNEEYKKATLNVNDELKLGKNVKMGFDVSGYRTWLPQTHTFEKALKAPPIVNPYNEEQGLYNRLPEGLGGNDVGNPLYDIDVTSNHTYIGNENNVRASMFAEINFLKNFTYRANLYSNFYGKEDRSYSPISLSYNMETAAVDTSNSVTSVYQGKSSSAKYQQEHLLTFKKQWGDHSITVMGGFSTYFETYSAVWGSVKQYTDTDADPIPNDKRWWYLNVFPYGDPESQTVSSSQVEKATVSQLLRVLYNFKGKYVLNTSYRRDGSSSISPSHRYQNFWAVGGAWEMGDENFMKNQKVFDELKLKGSIGQLGNQNTSVNYPYYPNYQNGTSAIFGDNILPSYVLAYRNDSGLRWETVTAYEGGVEVGILNAKLFVEANYFNRTTKDLLTSVNDGSQTFYTNAGSVRSSGFEFSASWNETTTFGLKYSLSGNLTTYNSKVLSVWKPGYTYTSGSLGQSRTEEGMPIGYFYGYVVDKLDEDGNFVFKDIDKDGIVTKRGSEDTDDRTMIGNPTPKFTYGFTGSVSYKNFDLSIGIQGVYGNQLWRNWGNEGAGVNIYNFRAARLGRWTGEGTSTWEPQMNTAVATNMLNSNYMIEDGSYIRIRSLQVGYSFKPETLGKLKITQFRVFVSGQNLVTWKHNSGFTPEAGGSALSFGIDGGGYPIPAIISGGLNLTL